MRVPALQKVAARTLPEATLGELLPQYAFVRRSDVSTPRGHAPRRLWGRATKGTSYIPSFEATRRSSMGRRVNTRSWLKTRGLQDACRGPAEPSADVPGSVAAHYKTDRSLRYRAQFCSERVCKQVYRTEAP